MAQMVPDAMPDGCSIGEKMLFSRLQSLDDHCIAYYEPPVGDRYPDFVVILPTAGLLVIEVKGWLPHQMLGGDSHGIQIRLSAREPEKTAANPIRQAREYMYRLMDFCKRHPAGKQLLQESGVHKGKFSFPFGYCAVLSQISDDQLRQHPAGDLRTILPSEHVVGADEFEMWSAFTTQQLQVRLSSFFNPAWTLEPLNTSQINALRAIIHPEVLVPPTPGELVALKALATQVLLIDEPVSVKTLDIEQERTARSLGSGHRLLFGVAGSGKTVVLVGRAKFLSEARPSGRTLVLCFNVSFRSYLKSVLAHCRNVDVYTFHGWGARNGVKRTEAETAEDYGKRLLEVLQSGGGDAGYYDAVLIDEAQDFEPSWFRCATAAMKEPKGGDLLVVGDGNQTHYRRGTVSWVSVGIRASGRTRTLRKNYRNTRSILEIARPFAADTHLEDGITATGCDPGGAVREVGARPILLQRASRHEEVAAIEGFISDLLAGKVAGEVSATVSPSDIAVWRSHDRRTCWQ